MYKYFDTLKEPTRFLVFFIPATILITGIYVPYPIINFISGGLLLIALVTRMAYIYKGKRGKQND